MFELGIDDVGRGPVIGPMVLAGCLINKKNESKLKKLGVKDSKLLTKKRRDFLEEKIKEFSETYEIIIIYPKEIEKANEKKIKLNEVEAIACAKIINKINKGFGKLKIFIDCPSVSIIKWSDFLRTKIKNLSNLEINCEHKADKNHVSVSCASILAKSVREREMDKIKEKYGKNIGSGYCSDPLTTKFLENHAQKYENDGIFRKTWVTWKEAYNKVVQKTLV
ncbi:MAG: ribonuclease HII [Nanoarchaeota archaeon]